MTVPVNDQLVLIYGDMGTGKSSSLRNVENALYINCEAGKRLPFKPKNFKTAVITDPNDVPGCFEVAETMPDRHDIILDGLNYLMDMYESVYVLPSTNTQSAWGGYAQFFRNLMQQSIAKSSKNVIITAHAHTEYNETALSMETKVPVKGALKGKVESYFSCVIAAKKMKLKDLESYQNDLLHISPRDEAVGYKHVFQTNITANTVHERIRSPMGLFSDAETFIDNDITLVLQRLREYYAD